MAWRLAKSLETLRSQVNEKYPGRSKKSDGTIGDAAHASRSSDHNPWVKDGRTGVVTALDITHDPKSGCDSYLLAEGLRASRDPRIKYIISNKRICSSEPKNGKSAWAWRPYAGSNAHSHHVHVSVREEKKFYDATGPWELVEPPPKKPITQSKIAAGSATVGGAEVVDAGIQIKNTLDTVSEVKGAAEGAGVLDFLGHLFSNPRFIFALVVIAIVACIIYWRWREHR